MQANKYPTWGQVIAVGTAAAAAYGGWDLISFAWNGEDVSAVRAIWLTVVGVGLLGFAVKEFFTKALHPRPKTEVK